MEQPARSRKNRERNRGREEARRFAALPPRTCPEQAEGTVEGSCAAAVRKREKPEESRQPILFLIFGLEGGHCNGLKVPACFVEVQDE